jgi:hypothetical protein
LPLAIDAAMAFLLGAAVFFVCALVNENKAQQKRITIPTLFFILSFFIFRYK